MALSPRDPRSPDKLLAGLGRFLLRQIVHGLAVFGGLAACAANAQAAPCVNPGALGVTRTITVDARTTPFIGKHDYGVTLPLAPGEVVLTFDDGPLPPRTTQVLNALARECVRATFFMVGRQARANAWSARQVRAAGHTIGTHTQSHPLFRMPFRRATDEIEAGVASVSAALGEAPAPFFRFPGLYRTREAEAYLRGRGVTVWSVDVDSNDWKGLGVRSLIDRTMAQLEARRGGILLMHDIKPNTAQALPMLLARMKARGFRIVHVVPSGRVPIDLIARAPQQGNPSHRHAVRFAPTRVAGPPATPPMVVDPRAGGFQIVFEGVSR
jgi:peptidoglycan-N-acetylglucosamine deacetylase